MSLPAPILEYGSQPRSPLRELIAIAAPTVAQMASYTVMQFIDTKFISYVGDTAASAVSSAGMFAFCAISLGFGSLFVINTLVSQSYGEKDFRACGQFLSQGLWFSLLFTPIAIALLPVVMFALAHFGHSADMLAMENTYLPIVICASPFKLAATAMGQFLLATNRPNTVLLSAVAGVSINAVAAYAMVFGKLGLPAMGVAGAAWAQNIGVVVEMLTLVVFAFNTTSRRKFFTTDLKFRLSQFKALLKIGIPSGVQIAADVLAWSLFLNWVLAPYGPETLAANTYVIRYISISFMPAFGLSIAVTALVGRAIGEGRPAVARSRANLGFAVSASYMISCAVLFLVFRHSLIGLFTDSPEVLRIGALILAFAAAYQFFDAVYITYNGALRGAGDTFFPALVTAYLNWSICVAGDRFIADHFTYLGAGASWSAACLYGVILSAVIYTRFRRGKWMNLHVAHDAAAESATPAG